MRSFIFVALLFGFSSCSQAMTELEEKIEALKESWKITKKKYLGKSSNWAE